MKREPSLDMLLDLDGQIIVIDQDTRHWVRFVVTQVPATSAKPHGLDYSLTLHGPDGERMVGYDNAHPIRRGRGPGGKAAAAQDHKHRLRTIQPYAYTDAASLLADFWTDVRAVLKERGVSI
jgi:hypothetical protein